MFVSRFPHESIILIYDKKRFTGHEKIQNAFPLQLNKKWNLNWNSLILTKYETKYLNKNFIHILRIVYFYEHFFFFLNTAQWLVDGLDVLGLVSWGIHPLLRGAATQRETLALAVPSPSVLLFFVSVVLPSILTPLFLPSSSVSLPYAILAVAMRECFWKHSCMSYTFPTAILCGTCLFRQAKYVDRTLAETWPIKN